MSAGFNAKFAAAFETVFCDGTVPPTQAIDMLSTTWSNKIGRKVVPTCSGDRNQRRVVATLDEAGGGLSMLAQPDGMLGLMFKAIFSQCSTTALGGGAYQHVFTALNSSTPKSLAIYLDELAEVFLFPGSVIASCDWANKAGEEARITFNGYSQKPQLITRRNDVPAIPNTAREFTWEDCVVTLNSAQTKLIENLAMKIDNSTIKVPTFNGTPFIQKFDHMIFKVNGSFDIENDDASVIGLVWGDPLATEPTSAILKNVLEFDYQSDQEIASSGHNYELTFNFPAAVYLTGEPDGVPGPDQRIMQKVNFEGITDGTNALTVTLVNATASY